MRFYTTIKKPWFARYYLFTVTTDADGTNRTYFFDHDIRFAGGIARGGTGSALTISTDEPLVTFARLDFIRNKNGELVVPQDGSDVGATFEVRAVGPMMNQFGHIEGYRATLVRV